MTSVPESVTSVEVGVYDYGLLDDNTTEEIYSADVNVSVRRNPFGPRRFPQVDPLGENIFLFKYYGYPVIFSIGTVGNILSYLVFTRSRLKKISAVHYMAAMAITDTGFLWTFFLTQMHMFYKIPIAVQDGLCQFNTFLNYVFTFLSIWYLVALVVDKFIGVYCPLKKSSLCTPFRAKLVMSFMAVVAVACYSYVVYFFGPDMLFGQMQCMPWPELRIHFENLSKIDTVVIAITPYGVIIILLFLILIRSCESYRISSSSDSYSRENQSNRSAQVARMVFPMVILTLISNLPVMVMRISMTLFGKRSRAINKWNMVFYVAYIMNFSVKYFVYTLCSKNFVKRTWKLLKIGRRKVAKLCWKKAPECDPQRITMEQVANGNKRAPSGKVDI